VAWPGVAWPGVAWPGEATADDELAGECEGRWVACVMPTIVPRGCARVSPLRNRGHSLQQIVEHSVQDGVGELGEHPPHLGEQPVAVHTVELGEVGLVPPGDAFGRGHPIVVER
jgi:hypothetical protein